MPDFRSSSCNCHAWSLTSHCCLRLPSWSHHLWTFPFKNCIFAQTKASICNNELHPSGSLIGETIHPSFSESSFLLLSGGIPSYHNVLDSNDLSKMHSHLTGDEVLFSQNAQSPSCNKKMAILFVRRATFSIGLKKGNGIVLLCFKSNHLSKIMRWLRPILWV